MVLLDVKENNGWLSSRWNLTYSIGWQQICKAVNSVYQYYNNVICGRIGNWYNNNF